MIRSSKRTGNEAMPDILVLRISLETPFNHIMESVSTLKEERDPYYIKGFQKGLEIGRANERARASSVFAERLILGTHHTDEVIAILAGTTIAFVKAKRRSVGKKNGKKT